MVDILWLLVCSGLVFLMQPGFMCLESGLTRSKNSINVAIKNLADFAVSVALFWAFGYAIMFGVSQAGWIGASHFFINIEGNAKLAVFFLFQAMFCGTATTIVSGAVAERLKFRAYLLVSCLISGLIYPFFGHWAWSCFSHWVWDGMEATQHMGWLSDLGFVDFAGSSVVHSVGGWVSLAVLVVVGPRTGRFPTNGKPQKIQGSNLPLSVLGAMLLWVGWLGFNGGSNLTLSEDVAGIIVHTVLAGVAGLLAAGAISWQHSKIPEVEVLINGALAGLVAITASCHATTNLSAIVIGAVGGVVMVWCTQLLERFRIDDAVDAIPVHLGAGIWGTLAAALFGQPALLDTGLNSVQQFFVQLLGIGVCGLWAFGIAYLLLRSIDRFLPLRVSVEEEKVGLNVSEHQAKTEIYDLFKSMDCQAQTQDLSLRVPVEPFTEVGQIATRYNQVMDALEEAMMRTDNIVKTAMDAIITFAAPNLEVMTANPSATAIFGYSTRELLGLSFPALLASEINQQDSLDALLKRLLATGRHEIGGRRADGSIFPLEVTLTIATLGENSFYTGTFRDISERKEAEVAIAQANWEITQLNDRLKAENLRLGTELDITRRLQQMLLPKEQELSQITGLDIAGFMEPATEVGGDYYDVLQHQGGVKIGIGDVTGHGLESGVLMIMVQTAVLTLLETNETDPRKFFDVLNRTIYRNVQRMESEKNLTLVLLDYQGDQLHLSGQHEEIIVVRAGGKIERVDTIDLGFPIGLEEDITAFVAQAQLQLNPGDVVVLYTDGITEAENLERVRYGLERLCQVISRSWQRPAREIRQAVIEDVRRHIGTQKVYDDITLLVMKRKQNPEGSA